MEQVLVLGYGNADRQDDGVAWHILAALAERLGRTRPASPEESFDLAGASPELLFVPQLTPELAETIARYARVCFVDAHTGSLPDDVYLAPVESQYQSSPFTHHLTAHTCLALAQALYSHSPQAVLVSVRGYEFGFSHSLSPRTVALANEAVELIWNWLYQSKNATAQLD